MKDQQINEPRDIQKRSDSEPSEDRFKKRAEPPAASIVLRTSLLSQNNTPTRGNSPLRGAAATAQQPDALDRPGPPANLKKQKTKKTRSKREILPVGDRTGSHSRLIKGPIEDVPRNSDFLPPLPHRLPEDILVQASAVPPVRTPDTRELSPQVQIFTESSPTAGAPLLSDPPPQHSITSRRRFSARSSPDAVAASKQNEQAHQRLHSYSTSPSPDSERHKNRGKNKSRTNSKKFVTLLRQA
mmetsp:Transcript_9940/g.20114  ORF Transcript_9940/g.20114 Transcript_9940/m.20114 type:complete len:242 (+) Transcript_9940:651-1376(+)